MQRAMFIPGFLAGLVVSSVLAVTGTSPRAQQTTSDQQPQKTKSAGALSDNAALLAEAMKKAERYTKPGEHHKLLERFIGKWDTESRLILAGQATPADKGTVETSWLIEGRWLKSESKGTMMGQPFDTFMILGYDNFKMSYVNTVVNSADTAMVHSEGDLDPGGKALLMYGTLDEYTTGEQDKMVKTVIRFASKDKMIMEIHDLPIGERNTKVVEVVYTRQEPWRTLLEHFTSL